MMVLMLSIFMAAGSADAGHPGHCTAPDWGCYSASEDYCFTCGDDVTSSCILEGSMTCEEGVGYPTGHGLVVGTDNITIEGPTDEEGNPLYYIDGVTPGECSDYIVNDLRAGIQTYNYPGYSDITIKNLEIKNFCNGVTFYRLSDSTVENCDVHHNGVETSYNTRGMLVHYVENCTIRGNKIHHTSGAENTFPHAGAGILFQGGTGNEIVENIISDNQNCGIFFFEGPQHFTFAHNEVTGNGRSGIQCMCECTPYYGVIEYNLATGNYGPGILTRAQENTIRYNESRNNLDVPDGPYMDQRGYGILIYGSAYVGFDLHHNISCDNEREDIYNGSAVIDLEGHDNRCDTTYNYNDTGYTACSYECGVLELDADFSGSPTSGTAPLSVDFSDETTGGVPPYTYEWDLNGDGIYGDGNGEQNPTYEYTSPGRYTVSLKVTDSEEHGDTETKEDYIDVFEPGAGCRSIINPEVVFRCGDVVTESCTLDDDMACSSGHGLIIGAADITIDGNGCCLDGVAPGNCNTAYRAGIYNYDLAQTPYARGYNNVTIKNLEIKNFCNGIEIISAAPTSEKDYFVKENTIECCDIHHNGNPPGSWTYYGDGVSLMHVSESTIKKCKLHDGTGEFGAPPGGCGIYLEGGDWNEFTENIITDNYGTGIFIRMYPEHNIITHNYTARNLFAGIRLMCVNTRYTECEYNYSTDNECAGIMVGGPENTIRYNTSTDNKNTTQDAPGIGGVPPYGWGIVLARSAGGNNISFNTACANEQADIEDRTILGNSGASNACDNAVNWIDTDDPDSNGCRYACFSINGTVTGGSGLDSVAIENLDPQNTHMKRWDQVQIDGANYYHSMGGADPNGVVRDVAECNIIRLIAKDGENAIGVEDHTVTPAEMTASAFTQDILMDEWYLDLHKFPWYEAKDGNTTKYSGPAVARMWLSYLWWDNAYGPGCPPDYEQDQDWLLTYGMDYNYDTTTEELLDPRGLRYTVQHNDPSGYNFSVRKMNDEDYALHTICRWIAYDVYNNPAGHPDHVPAATPTNGNYHNWMAPRGVHTSDNPWTAGSYDVFGFWINDPAPDGIGANSYKTATEWSGDLAVPDDGYYQKIVSGDECNDKYVAIVEPPDHDAEVRIVRPAARFERAIRPVMTENLLEGFDETVLIEGLEDEDALDVVKAAIDGVTDELIPYDPLFAAAFAKTVAGGPLLVNNESGDYYLVSFNLPVKEKAKEKLEIQELDKATNDLKLIQEVDGKLETEVINIDPILVNKKNTLVVVLVNAEDGSFKETSWVDDPMKYLPVSKEEALKLVLADVGTSETKPIIELVNIDNSPYYPAWKITIDKKVFYVSQDGTVSM